MRARHRYPYTDAMRRQAEREGDEQIAAVEHAAVILDLDDGPGPRCVRCYGQHDVKDCPIVAPRARRGPPAIT